MQCITNNSIKHQSFVYTQLNDQIVLFLTIQFSISSVFVCTQLNVKTVLFQTIQFSISTQFFVYTQLNVKTVRSQTTQFSQGTQFKCQTVLFDPKIGPYQLLPPWARVDLRTMTMKGYSSISQSCNITGTSPSDCLVSYQEHSLWEGRGFTPL